MQCAARYAGSTWGRYSFGGLSPINSSLSALNDRQVADSIRNASAVLRCPAKPRKKGARKNMMHVERLRACQEAVTVQRSTIGSPPPDEQREQDTAGLNEALGEILLVGDKCLASLGIGLERLPQRVPVSLTCATRVCLDLRLRRSSVQTPQAGGNSLTQPLVLGAILLLCHRHGRCQKDVSIRDRRAVGYAGTSKDRDDLLQGVDRHSASSAQPSSRGRPCRPSSSPRHGTSRFPWRWAHRRADDEVGIDESAIHLALGPLGDREIAELRRCQARRRTRPEVFDLLP